MCVSYPRHQSQFGSSAKIWIKLAPGVVGGAPNFFSIINHRGRSNLMKGDFIISLLACVAPCLEKHTPAPSKKIHFFFSPKSFRSVQKLLPPSFSN